MSQVFQFPRHFPAVFPKFTRISLKVVHCGGNDGYILNVPLRFISGTLFWRILGFTGWEHHGCTAGDTAKYSLNEPLGNIAVTFFGKLEVYPTYYLMGTSWLHDLEHCECTGRFLTGDIMFILGNTLINKNSISPVGQYQ